MVSRVLLFTTLLFVFFTGCASSDFSTNKQTSPVKLEISQTDTLTIKLLNDDKQLVYITADMLQIGVVNQVNKQTCYNPYPLITEDTTYTPPEGLEWRSITSAQKISDSTFEVNFGDITAKFVVQKVTTARFRLKLTEISNPERVAYYRLSLRAGKTEHFLGLGEAFDSVENRGKIRTMQIEVDSSFENYTNEAHVPVPLLIGTNGWGLFVNAPFPGVFEVATEEDDLIRATFGVGWHADMGFEFYLFADDKPINLYKHYYDLTGYPKLPAPWALGPWIWRDENENQEQVENDLRSIRNLDLAINGYWIDRPYASCVNSFDFDPQMFPQPQQMIDLAHELGIRMALWHTPYLEKNCEASKPLHEYAEEHGYYPPETGVRVNHWGTLIDFTNPDAYAWWQSLLSNYTTMGIEGFKLDYAEDVVPGLLGARNAWEFYDGSDELIMQSQYQVFYHRVYSEMLPKEGGFLLCRAGTYGDQVNGCIIWPGDLDADFSRFGEIREDNGKKAVGGLPASIIAGVSLSASGFPFYGADTGGYRHSPPDKECLTRWFEQTAFSTVMQVGNSASTVPWEFDSETGYDEEMLNWFRKYARWHLRLFPYLWTYAKQIAQTGKPIARPLCLVYPQLEDCGDVNYLLGDYLLVAPVVERGARTKTLYLPQGNWLFFWSGEHFDGEQEITVDAPLGTLPLFISEGGIVPLLRPTIDTLNPTEHPDEIDSFATSTGVLYARIAPGNESTFTVYDGTVLTQSKTSSELVVGYTGGKVFNNGIVFEVMAVEHAPTAIEGYTNFEQVQSLDDLEKNNNAWYYDSTANMLYIKVSSDGELKVKL